MYRRFNEFLRDRRQGIFSDYTHYAHADIRGDSAHISLHGDVDFYSWRNGVIVVAELWGLPYMTDECAPNILAMHLHTNGDCTGTREEPFSGAGGHYNPTGCPHPAHAGDMPPLFVNRGYAWLSFYTERLKLNEVVGRSVIIHDGRDDFTSQPAGNAGGRIACGVVYAINEA